MELTIEEIDMAFKDVPSVKIEKDMNITELLVNNNIVSSKRELREFLSSNAISINDKIVNDENFIVSKENAIYNKFSILKRGKKKYYLLKF